MKGYASKVIAEVDPNLLSLRDVVARLVDDLREDDDLRCHELAHAVGETFSLTVVDGKYGSVDHSWCLIGRFILDVYCVGRLPMVQLIDTGWQLPHGPGVYRVGEVMRADIDRERVEKLATFFELSVFRAATPKRVEDLVRGPQPPTSTKERDNG